MSPSPLPRATAFLRVPALAMLAASPCVLQPAFGAGERIETVIVTASPFNADADSLATIPAHLGHDDLLRQGGGNIADALSTLPGISATGFATGASRPIIRGMDASRVRVLENGSGSSDASDIGPDHGVPLDPLSARSIEVVRGAAALRYGSQAIGGVVNAVNNRVPLTLPTEASGEASTGYGAAAGSGEIAMLGDIGIGNAALHADGFHRNVPSYETPLGLQANSFSRGEGAALGGSYFFGDNRVGGALVHYGARYGILGEDAFIDMRQTKYLFGSAVALGQADLKVDASYGDYKHREIEDDGQVHATFLNKEFDGRAEVVLGRMGVLSNTAIGVQVQNRDFSALGHGAEYLLPSQMSAYAAFAFAEADLMDRLTLQASARIEQNTVKGTPASDVPTTRGFTPLSAALGLLFDASDTIKLGVSASSTARAPAQTELYARGAHDGSGTFETGDPMLGMERSNAVETSLRLRYADFTFDGSAYSNSFDNYVHGALTGRDCDEDGACGFGTGGPLRELHYTQGSAWFRGLEGKASWHVWHAPAGLLKVTGMGDVVRATLAGGANVPRIPAWRIGGGLEWESDALDAGFQVIRVGVQDKPGLFDTPTGGYVSVDASLTWRPVAGLALSLVGQNLADEVVRNAAAFNKDRVVMPGRNIRLVLNYKTN